MIIPLGFFKKTVSGSYPAYVDNGGYATNVGTDNTTLDISNSTVVDADDILIMHLYVSEDATAFTHTGWTEADIVIGHLDRTNVIMWKRAVGNEDATDETVDIDFGASRTAKGIIYRFSGCVDTGTPIEVVAASSIGTNTGSNLSINPTGNSTGNNRLATIFYWHTDNVGVTDNTTGYTQEYFEAIDEQADHTFAVYSEEIPTSTDDDGNVELITGTSETNSYTGFYLIPA